jgi:hypothetical protein
MLLLGVLVAGAAFGSGALEAWLLADTVVEMTHVVRALALV